MKKILVMVIIAAMSISAHAGAVAWMADTVYLPTITGAFSTTMAEGAKAYLFESSVSKTSVEAAILAGTFTGAGSIANTDLDDWGEVSATGIGSYESQTVVLWMLVFNTSSAATAGWYMISENVSKDFGSSGGKTFTFTDSHFPSSWSLIPVPEPATMALVGIGVVALGLRRRRK